MSSDVEIANLALNHLAVGKQIADLETERSQESLACRAFFEVVREKVLRDFDWPFCTRFVALSLVEEDPTEEWAYSYRYPSSCLKIRRIRSGSRNDSRQSRVAYRMSQDDDGQLILTDQEEAEIEFTYLETNPERYSADFVLAMSFLLASYIAPRLTAGDPFKLGERAMAMYLDHIGRARSNSVNEEQPDELVDSEFIRSRE